MRIGALLALAACSAIGVLVGATPAPVQAEAAAIQSAPSIRIDDCIEVSAGDQFEVDIRARGVNNLIAWEVYFAYNRHLIEVINKDVNMLLATGRGASVFDVSDPVPNSTGFYRMGAADVGSGDSLKQGDVLVRLTLRAKAEGVTPANIYRDDYNRDGTIDYGPVLTAAGTPPTYLGDTNGDQLFDGEILSGQIAIGTDCMQPPPALQPGESEGVPGGPGDRPGPESGPPSNEEGPDDGNQAENSESESDPTGGGEELQNSESQDTDNEDPDAPGVRGDTGDDGNRPGGGPNDPQGGDAGGIGGGGIVPWLLIGLGVAVAASGGITFYMIRAASREPY
jgi:hypothetical protein